MECRHYLPRLWLGRMAIAMLAWLAACSSNSMMAGSYEARVRLGVTALDGSPLPTAEGTPVVRVGDEFWLTSQVMDLRATPAGVYASFADIIYDPAAATVIPETLEYSAEYPNFWTNPELIFASPGELDEVGAGGRLEPPAMPGSELWQFRIQMRADATGITRLDLNPAENLPRNDVLLWQLSEPLSHEHVEYVGVAVSIVPEPASFASLAIGTLALLAGKRRARK